MTSRSDKLRQLITGLSPEELERGERLPPAFEPHIKPVHGPWRYGLTAEGFHRAGHITLSEKVELLNAIREERCECALCEKHGQRPIPVPYMWLRRLDPRYPTETWPKRPTWLCGRPYVD